MALLTKIACNVNLTLYAWLKLTLYALLDPACLSADWYIAVLKIQAHIYKDVTVNKNEIILINYLHLKFKLWADH